MYYIDFSADVTVLFRVRLLIFFEITIHFLYSSVEVKYSSILFNSASLFCNVNSFGHGILLTSRVLNPEDISELK